MIEPVIERQPGPCPGEREFEFVERKGVGHPDSVCDGAMEAAAVALSRAYIKRFGQVLHYNLDKALLVAGRTTPRLGGGRVDAPMRLVIGDRATDFWRGERVPVAEIVDDAVRRWVRAHLRMVDPDVHLVIQNELRRGSEELAAVVGRTGVRPAAANDSSIAVGFAPLTETERLALAAEHYLNAPGFKRQYPETGEDVKVMAVRRGRRVELTVAMAFIDAYLWELATYTHRKSAICAELETHLQTKLESLDSVAVELNTLDDPTRGAAGVYLTVLGVSAEAGDSGQVGRGNRANGLITPCRPMSLEAVCGKNPLSHVGKVYNALAQDAAEAIVCECPPVRSATVWLCSRIGAPLDQPRSAAAAVSLEEGVGLGDVRAAVTELLGREVAAVGRLCERLADGRRVLG